MFPTSIPGSGPRTLVRIVPTGWDYLLWILLPPQTFARRIARLQLEIYGGNPLKNAPLMLIELPDGSQWRVIDASSEVQIDLDVVPFIKPEGTS